MAGSSAGGEQGGGRSSGLGGFGVAKHGRGSWRGFWASGVALSTAMCSVAALCDSGHGGVMAGGAGLRALVERWLEDGNGGGEQRGEMRSSQGGGAESQWPRGRTETDESTETISRRRR